jgi:FdhE protein
MKNILFDENTIDQAIHTTAEYALIRRPPMTDLIKAFTDLFLQKDRCMAHLSDHTQPVDLTGSHDRMMSGIPILAALSLAPWREPLEIAFEWMLPAVKNAFPAIVGDVDAIMRSYRDGSLQLVLLAEEYLDGSIKHYDPAAQSIGVSGDALGFIMRTVLSATLGSLASKIGEGMGNKAWSKGYCPVCGTLPSVSFLAGPSGDPGEFLKDTGGQKFLHCGLCSHNWRINRHACPACDNTDKEFQMYLMEPDQPGERVDVCQKCGLYLPCVDMREREAIPHFDTAAVCMVHLDIMAQKQGFKPLSDLPWNRIEG